MPVTVPPPVAELMPVTVMVYGPVGVPPLPPPLLLLLQAGRRSRVETITPSIRKPNNFLRRDPADPKPAPSKVIAPIGSNIA